MNKYKRCPNCRSGYRKEHSTCPHCMFDENSASHPLVKLSAEIRTKISELGGMYGMIQKIPDTNSFLLHCEIGLIRISGDATIEWVSEPLGVVSNYRIDGSKIFVCATIDYVLSLSDGSILIESVESSVV